MISQVLSKVKLGRISRVALEPQQASEDKRHIFVS